MLATAVADCWEVSVPSGLGLRSTWPVTAGCAPHTQPPGGALRASVAQGCVPRLLCVRPWTSTCPPLHGLSVKKLSCARPCFLVILYHRSQHSLQLLGVYKHLLVSPAAWWVLLTRCWWRVQWICPSGARGLGLTAIPTRRILDSAPRVAHTGAH